MYMIRDEFAPFPSEGFAAVHIKGHKDPNRFYVHGGKTRFNQFQNPLHLYYVEKLDWKFVKLQLAKEEDPNIIAEFEQRPRAHHTVNQIYENRLLLYGGQIGYNPSSVGTNLNNFFKGLSGKSTSDVNTQYDPYIYDIDLSQNTIQRIRTPLDLPIPKPRRYHSACSFKGNLYVYGGEGFNYSINQQPKGLGYYLSLQNLKRAIPEPLNDFWMFDTKLNVWKQLKSPARPGRYGHMMVLCEKREKFYVVGGCGTSERGEDVPFKEILEYDIASGNWQISGLIPRRSDMMDLIPARWGSADIFDDFIFIVGGELLDRPRSLLTMREPILDDVLIYNIRNYNLSTAGIGSPECTIVNAQTLIFNNRLIVLGGRSGSSYAYSSMIYLNGTTSNPMFGVEIDERSRHMIDICVSYLKKSAALEFPKLFSTNYDMQDTLMLRLMLNFDHGHIHDEQDLLSDHDTSPYSVASLICYFLESLPEPILTSQYYRKMIDLCNATNLTFEEKIVALKEFIKTLPKDNVHILYRVCEFLCMVSDAYTTTEQNIKDLSMIFSHLLLSTKIPSQRSVKDDCGDKEGITPKFKAAAFIIQNYKLLTEEIIQVDSQDLFNTSDSSINQIDDNESNPTKTQPANQDLLDFSM
ncbi:rho GTPase activating protein [Naegleria gruberi]|uniref:Rho GTPase activating protein n=1 Tax=Naegleria gruberi TaxID=5762 RepID=D2VWN0_NAEGR|nr:rho GTPase activating protein [Naegleria gruberi]EFC38723.1 rho GTPase activating protein [Naegleria gruberi]|eukprot:XP_002671467.1 rho GTPase activating protein [Naegleria gruberi strain NEG-M]